MKLLKTYIDELEMYIPKIHETNKNISQATVGWQVGHSLMVINAVIRVAINSKPEEYKPNFNIKRILIFAMNKLPRGKAKAPQSAQPNYETLAEEDLRKKLAYAKENLLKLNELDKNSWFVHPFLGAMNLKNLKKFLALHTFHHIKIIRDILK
jgi:heat shock protein HspQ